jgi:hypothetical protein
VLARIGKRSHQTIGIENSALCLSLRARGLFVGACFYRDLLASPPRSRYHLRLINDVTRLLNALEQGNPHAAGRLLPLVYDELRKLAAQRIAQE